MHKTAKEQTARSGSLGSQGFAFDELESRRVFLQGALRRCSISFSIARERGMEISRDNDPTRQPTGHFLGYVSPSWTALNKLCANWNWMESGQLHRAIAARCDV